MEAIVDEVVDLYVVNEARIYSDEPKESDVTRGYEDLDLNVGFVDHALQAAKQAVDAGVDEETVVAALLHDIGWLAEKPKDGGLLTSSDEKVFLAKHDVVGSKMLRQLGFSDRLARLVEGHVQAKRYLTFKVDGYYDGLSNGSKFTLSHQGGRMSESEAIRFEHDPDFELHCKLRRWDEGAKIPDLQVPGLQTYREAMLRNLRQALWSDRSGLFSPETLTAGLHAQMEEQGYVVIRGWMTKSEVACLPAYAEQVATLTQDSSAPGPFHTYEEAKQGRVLSRTECFVDGPDSVGVSRFLKHGRLQQICTLLRGGHQQVLLKEKINYKLPGGGGYLPHQDGYWQTERLGKGGPEPDAKRSTGAADQGELVRTRLMTDAEVCVCMVAVDASTLSNGCPAVAPGWHNKGWLGLNADHEPLAKIETPVADQDRLPWRYVEFAPGDALIYGNMMPHKSEANLSDVPRRALFGIYADAETVGADIRERYYEYELHHRRAQGSAETSGKANHYFHGKAIRVEDR